MFDHRQIIFLANDTGEHTDDVSQRLYKKDRRMLWKGLFLADLFLALFFGLALVFYTSRINTCREEQMEQLVKLAAAYAAGTTDEEYATVTRKLRRDLIFSEYSADMESFADDIPNTAGVCCLDREALPSQVYLVCVNTGECYPIDIFAEGESSEDDYEVGYLSYGYDEVSQSNIRIVRNPGWKQGAATLYSGKHIASVLRMKSVFCESCIDKVLAVIKDCQIKEFVIYDRAAQVFYPIHDASKLQIGDYELEITYSEGNFEINILSV